MLCVLHSTIEQIQTITNNEMMVSKIRKKSFSVYGKRVGKKRPTNPETLENSE